MEPAASNREEILRVLNYWWTLESLNFSEIPKVSAEKNVRAIRTDADWPWKSGHYLPTKRNGKEFTWRHVVYLGVASSRRLVDETFDLFASQIPDVGGRLRNGATAIAALVVDECGRIELESADSEADLDEKIEHTAKVMAASPRISPESVTFSTLPWALARLTALATKKRWEGKLFSDLCDIALEDIQSRFSATQPTSSATFVLTMDRARDILSAWTAATKWDGRWDEFARVKSIEVRIRDGAATQLQAPILNSFYLEDLSRVMAAITNGGVGLALSDYLRAPLMTESEIEKRKDLRRFPLHAEAWLRPKCWTLGAWPHKGGHSLVYAQQCAVNAIWGELSEGKGEGIFAVNGPPGTGKTTLLADLVAATVTKRARFLAELPRARAGFGRAIQIKDKLWLYPAQAGLLGHEIVVASANNGAVENVTRELPALKKIDASWFSEAPRADYRYFPEIAQAALNPPKRQNPTDDVDAELNGEEESAEPEDAIEAWGLIAAVLGNARNRDAFTKTIWFSRDAKKGFRESLDAEVLQTGADAEERFATAQRQFNKSLAAVTACQQRAEQCAAFAADLDRLKSESAALDSTLLALTRDVAASEISQREIAAEANGLNARREASLASWNAADAAMKWLRERDASSRAQRQHEEATRSAEELTRKQADGSASLMRLREAADQKRNLRELHTQRRPVFWTFWFRRPSALRWESTAQEMDSELAQAFGSIREADAALNTINGALRDATARMIEWKKIHVTATESSAEHWKKVELAINRVGEDAPIRKLFRKCDDFRSELGAEHANRTNELADLESKLKDANRRLSASSETTRSLRAQIEQAQSKRRAVTAKADEVSAALERLRAGRLVIDGAFRSLPEEQRAQRSPWIDEEWRKARIKLFLDALALHRAYIVAAWKPIKSNLNLATELLGGRLPPAAAKHIGSLWSTLFLITPVVSTTFASMDRLFRGLGPGTLGWLVVDEAGQATPQMAVGGLWRARRAVIVGDPYQLQPVVTLPNNLVELLREQWRVRPSYIPGDVSVQRLADAATKWGALFGVDNLWVGCPLVVHRRCLEPMFGVANQIAYGRMMVHGRKPDDKFVPLFGESAWAHVDAPVTSENWIAEEGRLAVEMAQLAWQLGEEKSLFIITPFRSVADELKDLLSAALGTKADAWIKRSVGTVHTFQGKENANVVLVLGGDSQKPGVRGFVADEPNLLNVALTRAKERIYVVGNATFWQGKESLRILAHSVQPFGRVVTAERFRRNWRS